MIHPCWCVHSVRETCLNEGYIYSFSRGEGIMLKVLAFKLNPSLAIYLRVGVYYTSSSWRAASTDIPDSLSLHVSQWFIAFGRSSGIHPVSSHSCCMNVRAGRPAFYWRYAGVHRGTSLTISSLHLQQCPACLVRLACIVLVIGGRWHHTLAHI